MLPNTDSGLVTTAEASRILGVKRLEPYYRRGGKLVPVMRAGKGTRAPLLFAREDVEKLRDEILARLTEQLGRVNGGSQ